MVTFSSCPISFYRTSFIHATSFLVWDKWDTCSCALSYIKTPQLFKMRVMQASLRLTYKHKSYSVSRNISAHFRIYKNSFNLFSSINTKMIDGNIQMKTTALLGLRPGQHVSQYNRFHHKVEINCNFASQISNKLIYIPASRDCCLQYNYKIFILSLLSCANCSLSQMSLWAPLTTNGNLSCQNS